ncbi:MAG TPA: DUF3800 domain-containing protein [Herpetosiphonaceae bacterium]
MKKPKPGRVWYFVDEAGDPTFYSKRGQLIVGQPGCSPILILGFIQTSDPEPIRKAVRELQQQVINDPYFHGRRSLKQTAVAFHANNDLFEIRYLFFKLIASLDFRAKLIVARKIEQIFIEYDQRNQNAFYDHVVSCLFRDVLHLNEENHIYFAKRQSRARQAPLTAAIEKGRAKFEQYSGPATPTRFMVQAQTPSHEPCLSVIDYINWAVYQAYTSRDMNYFNTIRHKVSVVGDLYDRNKPHRNWYDRKHLFDVEKITPL